MLLLVNANYLYRLRFKRSLRHYKDSLKAPPTYSYLAPKGQEWHLFLLSSYSEPFSYCLFGAIIVKTLLQ